jgi:hypothetical protein
MKLITVNGVLGSSIRPVGPISSPLAYEVDIIQKVQINGQTLIGGNFSIFNILNGDVSYFGLGVDGVSVRVDRNNTVLIIPPGAVPGLVGLQVLQIVGGQVQLGPVASTAKSYLVYSSC